MKTTQTTLVSAVVEPVELSDLREHLRIEHNDEDRYLLSLIASARVIAENHIDGIIADREFQFTLDSFCKEIELPLNPVDPASIEVDYTDSNGAPQTVASFDYVTNNLRTVIKPNSGEAWPTTASTKDAVQITFTAGFAGVYGAVPEDIKHAVMMIAATLYDHRRDHTANIAMKEIPTSSRLLLAPYQRVTL